MPNKTNIEKQNLAKIEKLNGKVKFIYDKTTSEIKTFGILKIKDKYFIGETKRSLKDVFSRRIGRAIALGRAMKQFKTNEFTPTYQIQNYYRFVEDRT